MENNMKKLTPDDLQGLAGGWQDEDLTQEERDEWYTLVQTCLVPAKTPDVEKQDCIRGILIAKKK